jgi:hypothetical protein
MMKNFNQFILENREDETWQDVIRKQTDSGKFWKNLFKDEFEKHSFLDRADAVYACKKAKAEAFHEILELQITEDLKKTIEEKIEKLWKDDDSAVGLPGF